MAVVMFTTFLRLITGRPPTDSGVVFVRDVSVVRKTRAPRNRRTERLILISWPLILAKSWLVIWAIEKYHVPIAANWIIVPTVVFAALCTGLYFLRE